MSGAEAKTGLMCMQCNSVMKRGSLLEDGSEWDLVEQQHGEDCGEPE